MLYVSSQICHGRLIIFQPGADTDVWHDVFFCICLGLLTVGSSQVQTQMETVAAGNKSRLEQNAGFFCGKMLGKSPVF